MRRPGDRPQVYLIGTAGHPHYGDEVITAAWLRYYADRLPEADVWLDTPRPGSTAVLHSDSHPRLRCVDTLFQACWSAPTGDPAGAVAFGSHVIDNPGLLPREASGLARARQADIVHIMGGAYINDYWPQHLALIGGATRLASLSGAVSAATGASFAPAGDSLRSVLRESLGGLDVVDVRDEWSARLLEGAVPSLTLTGDDALLDLARQPVRRGSRSPVVVEVQSDLLDVPISQLADQVVALLQHWQADTGEVLVLESLPPGDSAVLELLSSKLPKTRLLPFEHLWRDGFPVSPAQLWISTRFHSHLMAAAAGAPGVALVGSDRMRMEHQSLVDLGSGWTVLGADDALIEAPAKILTPFDGQYAALVERKRAVAEGFVKVPA